MRTTYIYGIKCLEVDKYIYVGKSNAPASRYIKSGRSHNEDVQRLVKEKGKDSFQVECLEEVQFKASKDWIEREKFWITKFRDEGHPLCNRNNGGGGPTEHTEEAKAKIRKNHPDQSGENNPMHGVTREDHPMYGKHHTEETKVRLREANLGKYPSKETRAKISRAVSGENNGFYGEHHTSKTKLLLSELSKGNESDAKPYPAFYNFKAGQFIPSGVNLAKMCRNHNVVWSQFQRLRAKSTGYTYSGWRLATPEEIIRYGYTRAD